MNIAQYPNDRDYFFSENGDIYQVLGYVHPKDSIYCLKKYIEIQKQDIQQKKDENSFLWHSNLTNSYYERNILNYSSKSAEKNIAESEFRKYSELYGCDFIVFPRIKIKDYFKPSERLKELRNNIKSGKFSIINEMAEQEKFALEISYIFEEKLGFSEQDMGITGSMLWKGVHQHSDIDIIIYGIDNTMKFIKNSEVILKEEKRLRKPNTSELFAIGGKFSLKTGLSIEDCVVYTSLKKYLLYFNDYFLSIAFCPKHNEILENQMAIENTHFINISGLDNVTIKAKITNIDWGYFYPSIIDVKNIIFLKKPENSKLPLEQLNICRIVIFEHECSGYFKSGQNIEIRGLVQEIENPPPQFILRNALSLGQNDIENLKFHQIVIGTSENYGNEYIKNLDK